MVPNRNTVIQTEKRREGHCDADIVTCTPNILKITLDFNK